MRRALLAALLLLGSLSAASPQEGFPVGNASVGGVDQTTAWTTVTLTQGTNVACATGSPTTASGTLYYKTLGKSVLIHGNLTLTNVSGCSGGFVIVSLPNTANGSGILAASETASTGFMMQGVIGGSAADQTHIRFFKHDGSALITNGYRYDFSGVYEAQ